MKMLPPLSPAGLIQIPVAVARPKQVAATPPPDSDLAGQVQLSDKSECTRLRQACKDFEAMFWSYLLKRMRATVPEGGFLEQSREQRLFQDMIDEQMADRMAGSGQGGLAEALYQQMSARLDLEKDETSNKSGSNPIE